MTPLKQVLILSSTGGYGHCAAASTLTYLLQNEWESRIFHPINALRMFGMPAGESFYNFAISHNYMGVTNWAAGCVAPYLFQRRFEKTVRLIQTQLIKQKAELLISVIPYVNYPASEAARRQGIPFLLVTTDNDLSNWVYGMESMEHQRFKVTIGTDLSKTRGLLLRKGIPEESIETIGLPLRPAFLSTFEKQKLRFQRGISPHRAVVLIMMGGAGGNSAYQYAKILASLPLGLHLIVCAGRNRALATRLSSLTLAEENRLEILPFTDRVHELMALSDLIITKPGPGTINEAMMLKIPLIIDRTSTPLYWEEVNVDIVQSYGVGKAIYSMDSLERIVRQMLHPDVKERIARTYTNIAPNRFHLRLPGLIDELCQSAAPAFATASK